MNTTEFSNPKLFLLHCTTTLLPSLRLPLLTPTHPSSTRQDLYNIAAAAPTIPTTTQAQLPAVANNVAAAPWNGTGADGVGVEDDATDVLTGTFEDSDPFVSLTPGGVPPGMV